MKIHLKRNEKLFLNGAVIRLDRRGSIELLNDAQFLLEAHVMQQEDAKQPLQQIYFIVQSMLMDPTNVPYVMELFRAFSVRVKLNSKSAKYTEFIEAIEKQVEAQDFFGALKVLRRSFELDEDAPGSVSLSKVSSSEAA
ncbi:flagellar biosynthesis repressor FlbT [Aestuariivirga litoralis]|uniref:flagellar biosynthesis repressor FlbT n=1 Tax=Aestuariivirga litoralis TaxID=2650924 RepID=UPI0018C4781C|nr:flagellar biosynthesis repressor FlbT [Aestuariivirga litoralis]MBG1233177.1 flagellar biosynthesis repressor FlbT [Aestuariivirga litoralis]